MSGPCAQVMAKSLSFVLRHLSCAPEVATVGAGSAAHAGLQALTLVLKQVALRLDNLDLRLDEVCDASNKPTPHSPSFNDPLARACAVSSLANRIHGGH